MKLLLALLQPWKRLDRDELHKFGAGIEIASERTAVFGRRRIMRWPERGEREERAAERSRKQPQTAERRGRKLLRRRRRRVMRSLRMWRPMSSLLCLFLFAIAIAGVSKFLLERESEVIGRNRSPADEYSNCATNCNVQRVEVVLIVG